MIKSITVKQRSVRLGESNGRVFTTMDVPHSYVKDGSREYLICRYPEGDFAIHQINCGQELGYCGEVITFLMDDRELIEVKGPVPCDDLFEHKTAARLAKILDRPEIARKAFRIEIGTDLAVPFKQPAIIYEESRFILGDWRYRVRTAWAGMQIRIFARSGAACMTVDEVLAVDYQRVFNMPKSISPTKTQAKKCVT